jgi:hypothetical protein
VSKGSRSRSSRAHDGRERHKELGRAVASSAPKDVVAIEARLSTGKGLLHADGASRSNMYSGDAPLSSLTIATLHQSERHTERTGAGYLAYFSNPFSFVRTVVLMVGDIAKELWAAADQRPPPPVGLLHARLLRGVPRVVRGAAVIGIFLASPPFQGGAPRCPPKVHLQAFFVDATSSTSGAEGTAEVLGGAVLDNKNPDFRDFLSGQAL